MACLLSGLMALSGCGRKAAEDSAYKLYFLDSSETKLVSESYEMKANELKGQLAELVEAFDGTEPKNFSYKKAKPENIAIKEYWYDADGRMVTLNFDSSYSAMEHVSEILCRAAIVKTLCQIEGVEGVSFQVGGLPLNNSSGNPIGRMRESDFIDNMGGQSADVTVYFASEDGTKLSRSDITVGYDGTLSLEQIVLGQLLGGPIEEEIYPTIPEGTEILGVTTKDGVCYVDLNEKFMQKRPEVTAEVTIYSIVNSLVDLGNVNKVQFTINGEIRKTYDGIDFSGVFERNLELIESVD